jgi:hypothetical protein
MPPTKLYEEFYGSFGSRRMGQEPDREEGSGIKVEEVMTHKINYTTFDYAWGMPSWSRIS